MKWVLKMLKHLNSTKRGPPLLKCAHHWMWRADHPSSWAGLLSQPPMWATWLQFDPGVGLTIHPFVPIEGSLERLFFWKRENDDVLRRIKRVKPEGQVFLALVVNEDAIGFPFFPPNLCHLPQQPPMTLGSHRAHCFAFYSSFLDWNLFTSWTSLPRIIIWPSFVLPNPSSGHSAWCALPRSRSPVLETEKSDGNFLQPSFDNTWCLIVVYNSDEKVHRKWKFLLDSGTTWEPAWPQLRRNNKHKGEVAWKSGRDKESDSSLKADWLSNFKVLYLDIF